MATQVEQISMNQTQAARALGVTDRTLRKWREDGLLVPVKRGGATLYTVEAIKKFLAEEQTTASK